MLFKRMLLIIGSCLLLLAATISDARPVSYPGGWTVMQMNDADINSLHVHYSPASRYSIGYKGIYWRDDKIHTQSIQLNNLLKRWNNKESQANFYLKSGVGVAYDTSSDRFDDSQLHWFTGLSLDWEDRRYFIEYENSFHDFGNYKDKFLQSARVGIAPYIGDYGDLHTWLMFKVDHSPENKDNFKVTPMVRLFKDVNLIEIGVNEDKKLLFNVIIRF